MIWKQKWFQFFILFLVALIWGSSFILMKVGLKSFTSNQSAAIRIASAWLVLLPYSIKNLKILKKKDVLNLLVAGFIGSFFPAFLFTKAQTQIDSAMAGMLNSATPVFTLLIGVVFLGAKFKVKNILGLILGFVGAIGLIAADNNFEIGQLNKSAFLIILATVFYGININQVKSKLYHLTGFQVTSLAFLFIGPVAFAFLFATNIAAAPITDGWGWHLGALVVLGIVGTALALLLMYSLLRYASPVFASSVTYITPIFAIVWGILDHETISLYHLIFMAIILIGVYLINQKR